MIKLLNNPTQHPDSYLLVLLTLTLIIYLPALNSEFVIDDRTYFLDNDLLTSLKPWQLAKIFLEPSNYWGELLPIRDLLYVVEYNLFGKKSDGLSRSEPDIVLAHGLGRLPISILRG